MRPVETDCAVTAFSYVHKWELKFSSEDDAAPDSLPSV